MSRVFNVVKSNFEYEIKEKFYKFDMDLFYKKMKYNLKVEQKDEISINTKIFIPYKEIFSIDGSLAKSGERSRTIKSRAEYIYRYEKNIELTPYVEGEIYKDLIEKAEVMHPEWNAKPRVYYLGIPKRFIAGTVYYPKEKEVVISATCTLTDVKNGKTITTSTDGFGDFWFEGLENSMYSLKIQKNGKSFTIDSINTEKEANLGDIPLN